MDCDAFSRLLGNWMDGALDGRARVSMQAHEQSCNACRNLHGVRQSLRDIVRSSNADERVPKLIASILESVRRPRS